MNKISNRLTRKLLGLLGTCVLAAGGTGCGDFLDVMPDNVANMDHVFANKSEAENYLATLYTFPMSVTARQNFMFLGADDIWTFPSSANVDNYSANYPWRLARGEQNVNTPYVNCWEGSYGGAASPNYFRAIRECNTFLEEIAPAKGRLPDLDDYTRTRWMAEAKFLKAYYHFCLFRMYGPIPIVDTNLAIDEETSVVRVKRNKVEEVVKYIAGLLDECAPELPLEITSMGTEAGRVYRGVAYMLKAKLLVTAASPLFNGNSDYADFKDSDGLPFFPQEFSAQKWQDAVDACELALENLPNAALYTFPATGAKVTAKTQYKMNYRGAVTDPFNTEIIWGRYIPAGQSQQLQIDLGPLYLDETKGNSHNSSRLSATMHTVERFYTRNGVPLDEDKEWNRKWGYSLRYTPATADADQELDIIGGYETGRLNMDREPRFYGGMVFDGSRVFMNSVPGRNDANSFSVHAKFGQKNGWKLGVGEQVTGYWILKLINYEAEYSQDGKTFTYRHYPWPEMRLADLMLLYAEALNEASDSQTNRDLAIDQLDQIRSRVGLKGVKKSWSDYSTQPDKPNTQSGLREIIRQERHIERAFEHSHIWDIRRWKKAVDAQNSYVQGWNVKGKTASQYYQLTNLFEQRFVAPRDYLWPISIKEMMKNPYLVQNPGWQ